MKTATELIATSGDIWRHLSKNGSEPDSMTAKKFGMTEEQIRKLKILHGVGARDSFLQAYQYISEGT
jgi:hypothetical protein